MLLLLLLFFVNRCFIHSFSTDYPQHNSNAQQDTVVFRVPSWWLAKQLCIYSYSLPTVHIMIVYFFQKGPIKPSCVSALLASLHAVYIWCLLFHSPLFCSLQAFLHAVFQGSIQLFICFCLGVGVCLFLSPLPVEGVGGDLSQLGCSPETEKTQQEALSQPRLPSCPVSLPVRQRKT